MSLPITIDDLRELDEDGYTRLMAYASDRDGTNLYEIPEEVLAQTTVEDWCWRPEVANMYTVFQRAATNRGFRYIPAHIIEQIPFEHWVKPEAFLSNVCFDGESSYIPEKVFEGLGVHHLSYQGPESICSCLHGLIRYGQYGRISLKLRAQISADALLAVDADESPSVAYLRSPLGSKRFKKSVEEAIKDVFHPQVWVGRLDDMRRVWLEGVSSPTFRVQNHTFNELFTQATQLTIQTRGRVNVR